jgi:hypothetical protein
MWSWLIPHTLNLMEYFGFSSAVACTASCTMCSPAGPTAAPASGAIDNNPAAPTPRRNDRRFNSPTITPPLLARGQSTPNAKLCKELIVFVLDPLRMKIWP